MAQFFEIHPANPQPRLVRGAVLLLSKIASWRIVAGVMLGMFNYLSNPTGPLRVLSPTQFRSNTRLNELESKALFGEVAIEGHLPITIHRAKNHGRSRVQAERAGREIPAIVTDVVMGEEVGVDE